jgi:hypothetical protein
MLQHLLPNGGVQTLTAQKLGTLPLCQYFALVFTPKVFSSLPVIRTAVNTKVSTSMSISNLSAMMQHVLEGT